MDRSVAAELVVLQPPTIPDDRLSYAIWNCGTVTITATAELQLDRLTPSGWTQEPVTTAFAAWAKDIAPNARFEFSTHIPRHVSPGHYRLRTSVRRAMPVSDNRQRSDNDRRDLSAEFDIYQT